MFALAGLCSRYAVHGLRDGPGQSHIKSLAPTCVLDLSIIDPAQHTIGAALLLTRRLTPYYIHLPFVSPSSLLHPSLVLQTLPFLHTPAYVSCATLKVAYTPSPTDCTAITPRSSTTMRTSLFGASSLSMKKLSGIPRRSVSQSESRLIGR